VSLDFYTLFLLTTKHFMLCSLSLHNEVQLFVIFEQIRFCGFWKTENIKFDLFCWFSIWFCSCNQNRHFVQDIKKYHKIALSYTLCYSLYFESPLENRHIHKVTLSYNVLGKHKVNQGLTTLIVQLLDNPLIEH
jgi:hypothetical protein